MLTGDAFHTLVGASEPVVYELSAILIHKGPSAYSGHYIAHVKDGQAGVWRRLNDEETGLLKDMKSLGAEVWRPLWKGRGGPILGEGSTTRS